MFLCANYLVKSSVIPALPRKNIPFSILSNLNNKCLTNNCCKYFEDRYTQLCVFLGGCPSGHLSVKKHPVKGQTSDLPEVNVAAMMVSAWSQGWLPGTSVLPHFHANELSVFRSKFNSGILSWKPVLCTGSPSLSTLPALMCLLSAKELVDKFSDLVNLDAAILLDVGPYMQVEWYKFVTF